MFFFRNSFCKTIFNKNWSKILDPDPNSLYLDPQHCVIKKTLAGHRYGTYYLFPSFVHDTSGSCSSSIKKCKDKFSWHTTVNLSSQIYTLYIYTSLCCNNAYGASILHLYNCFNPILSIMTRLA